MLGFIYFGTREAIIGSDEFLIRCPACETHNYADVMVVSKYFHIYFIPMFPYAKEANIICQKCGLKRYGIPFEERLFSDFKEIKKRFKHPWYTYFFISFVLFVILTKLLFSAIG
jgi:hypothetical protein